MLTKLWEWLQLFADGGEGGSGDGAGTAAQAPAEGAGAPETVVQAGDDGQQHLRDLGVPEDALRKSARRKAGRSPALKEPGNAQGQQSAAAQNAHPNTAGEAAKDPTLKDLMQQYPSVQEEINTMMRSRVKGDLGAADNLAKLAPALSLIAKQQGVDWDPENPDYESLSNSVSDDYTMYEPYALEWGCTPEEAKERVDQDIMWHHHFDHMDEQAAAMAEKYPGFDLKVEMQNPAFRRMTAPGGGVSVEDAYWAIHRKDLTDDLQRRTEANARQRFSRSVQSGSYRPIEAGTSSQGPSTTRFDYANASRDQREAFKEELRRAWGRGETVYPHGG